MAKKMLFVACALAMFCSGSVLASGSRHTLYVDCEGTPGGTGSQQAPLDTITAAIHAGRTLSASYRVAIKVASGTCSRETLPIVLDYPLDLTGSRLPQLDSHGLPTGEQHRDTLVTQGTGPAPAAYFVVTADDVRVARLSVDGQLDPPPDAPTPPPAAPTGVIGRATEGLVLEDLRLVRLANGVRLEGAAGRLFRNFLQSSGLAGMGIFGGEKEAQPVVTVTANRVEYRTNGIILGGGIPAAGPQPAGTVLSAFVVRNDLITRYRNSGPSNPAAIRLNPSVQGAPEGHLDAWFLLNIVSGTPRYSIMVHGGQPQRDASPSTGSVRAVFFATAIDAETKQTASPLITFTNARATEFPCELNPANGRDVCPSLMGNPPVYWDYHEHTSYELWHGGELQGVRIDYPQIEPVDRRVLGNVLTINGDAIDYQTFVIEP